MSPLKKLTAFFIILIFSHAAIAVVVEGSVAGKAAEFYSLTSTNDISDEKYDVSGAPSVSGYLAAASQILHSPGANLIQDSPVLPALDVYDNVVSYAGLESSGVASRADYHGWMAVNLNTAEVNPEETVTVPEPSSLLLLVGPFLFLLWRIDLLPGILRKVR